MNIFKYSFLSGASGASLQISEEPGVLGAVIAGFDSNGVISLYDSATGTTSDPICVIRRSSANAERYDVGAIFTKGLYAKVEEAGSSDITVLWV